MTRSLYRSILFEENLADRNRIERGGPHTVCEPQPHLAASTAKIMAAFLILMPAKGGRHGCRGGMCQGGGK